MMVTITRIAAVDLTDAQIREAIIEYAKRKHGFDGEASAEISPDTSWASEGKGLVLAKVTFTTVEKTT